MFSSIRTSPSDSKSQKQKVATKSKTNINNSSGKSPCKLQSLSRKFKVNSSGNNDSSNLNASRQSIDGLKQQQQQQQQPLSDGPNHYEIIDVEFVDLCLNQSLTSHGTNQPRSLTQKLYLIKTNNSSERNEIVSPRLAFCWEDMKNKCQSV